MKSLVRTIGLAAALVTAFAACSEDDSNPTNPGPPAPDPPVVISLSPDSVVLAPGDTGVVVANWVRPTGVTSAVSISIRDVVGGVNATVGAAGASSTPITLVAVSSATDAWRYLQVTASGTGMSGATDSVLVRVTVPSP